VLGNAIKKKVQIAAFLLKHDEELRDACLSGSDWDMLVKIHAFLSPFASATLYAEGACSSVAQTLPLMDMLLLHYDEQKKHYSEEDSSDPRIVRAIDMGWYVLNKYHTLSEDVPVYTAALLLDPTKRMAYIEQNWPREWHDTAIEAARSIWKTEYQGLNVPQEPDSPPPQLKQKKKNG
jgi:hypothetical protein